MRIGQVACLSSTKVTGMPHQPFRYTVVVVVVVVVIVVV